ncbi:putative Ig domain-containing protein [Curtobacterium sp. MCBD17_023]|uniref:putative Ig domain-containing protein n=1 Tax=Curtobacterium sp. MCBD17_023 TaxID=2175657 RepID=UPI000D95EF2A|nr:putative Ig domain-containing protein [Curtobacterium sp. MCBD17_023]PYY45260.1 hypothetical protein DEI84_14825 [Curtobacterium sp. MCBD17_023]
MHRSTSFVRRACAVGTATALIGLTTGLGVMTATTAYADEAPTTDTSVTTPAAPGTNATPGTDATTAPGEATTPAEPSLPTDGATSAPGGTGATTGGAAAGTGAVTPTAPATGSAMPTPTSPSTAKPSDTGPAEAAPTAAASATVTISGTAKVGQTLRAKPKGFTDPSELSYSWSVGGVATGDQGQLYDVVADDAGKIVTVTVRNNLEGHTDETATADSAVVTQDPVFVDENGEPVEGGTAADEDSLPLEATAGEAFSYTFRATGSPAPTYSLAWYYDGYEADPEYPEDTPEGQLPDGITFDATTGVLSGTTEWASYYDFAVTATSGTATTTQYVELSVDAAAPAGVQVIATDRADYEALFDNGTSVGFQLRAAAAREEDSGTIRSWIVDEDGDIDTVDLKWSTGSDGADFDVVFTPGGRPTVEQDGTLLVDGGIVDRFGNEVTDDEGTPSALTVTSDVASDVITIDEVFGGYNAVDVTFPEASTHTLTATGDAFATSFPVVVTPTATTPGTTPPVATPPVSAPPVLTQPAAAPIGTVPVRTAAHGRLAYTGTDSTDALPWALAMLAAGAALVGLRTVRRRARR